MTISIRTMNRAFLGEVRKILPYGSKPCSGRAVRFRYSIDAPPRTRGGSPRTHTLWRDSDLLSRSRSVRRILETLESSLAQTVAEFSRADVFVHAGAVAWKGRAIVIPGRSFSGKSTLVAALVRAGAGYLSDEYAIVDSRGRVRPFARPIALRRPRDGRQVPTRIAGSVDWAEGPLPVGLVLVTRFRKSARFRPRRLSPGEVLLAMLSNTVPARTRPQAVLSRLQRVASGARGLKGSRGEADAAAAWILETTPRKPPL